MLNSCSEVSDDSKGDQSASGTLVVGTSADMPPFEFFSAQEGNVNIIGFDVDVVQLIADKLGQKIDLKDMDFNGLIPALTSGRVHMVIASLTPTTHRRKVVDFSDPYMELPVAVLSRPGIYVQAKSDLDGKKIGVQLGSSHEAFVQKIREEYAAVDMRSLNKLGELVQELRAGRIDVVIMETKTAREFQKNNLDLNVNVLEDEYVQFAIAMPKNSPLLDSVNAALHELRQQGKLAELRQKWFSSK